MLLVDEVRHFKRKAVASAAPYTGSVFKMENKKVCMVEGWTPPDDRYILPAAPNHPWIDRACVAFGPSGERCLVIYQDKINAASFGNAVRLLNEAATLLKNSLGYPVVCVAHVIQAPGATEAQVNFTHPYILVRCNEVDQFYTPTFATPIKYLMHRHNLSNLSGHEDDTEGDEDDD